MLRLRIPFRVRFTRWPCRSVEYAGLDGFVRGRLDGKGQRAQAPDKERVLVQYHVCDATRSVCKYFRGSRNGLSDWLVRVFCCHRTCSDESLTRESSWITQHLTILARCLPIFSLADHFIPSSLTIPALCSGPWGTPS